MDVSPRRQTLIGCALAVAIILGWITVHVTAVFLIDLAQAPILGIVALILLQTWLSVGLFIVAHDAMHGSLAPFRPATNRVVGRVALLLYAGFIYDRLIVKHHAHHRFSGGEGDPDFDARHPDAFLPWFMTFMIRYFDWRQLAVQGSVAVLWVMVLGASLANLVLFWAMPALLAAAQLFYFGTYRPHRHEKDGFSDRHNARSEDFPPWLSLLTCFHFGYHHEHHDRPQLPWWRLPGARQAALARQAGEDRQQAPRPS